MARKGEKAGSAYGPGQSFGRPATYSTPEELSEAVESYLHYSKQNDEPLTITGLVLHLGFAHRCSLDDYEAKGSDFAYIIKKARTIVENGYEKRLNATEGTPTGAIFALKNMGWSDRTDTNITGDAFSALQVTIVPPKPADD